MNQAMKGRQRVNTAIEGTKNTLRVGVDDGYAMTKVALPDGRAFKIPSRARAGSSGVSAISDVGQAADLDCGYETDGARYSVADYMEAEGTRFNEYPFSALNRVVIHHALRVAGLSGRRVEIATGLPVANYFQDGKPDVDLIRRKIATLQVAVQTVSGASGADIVAAYVHAEGVAAWMDYALDDKGDLTNVDMGAPAAVVDIGGRTTDCVLVLPGWKVDHARSGTGDIGVLKLYDAIGHRIRAKFSVDEIPTFVLERATHDKKIKLWGKDHDISELVAISKREVGDQILREVQRRIGSGHDLEKVLFVGGGAVVFDNLQTAFPNAIVAKEPEFANARGLMKYINYLL